MLVDVKGVVVEDEFFSQLRKSENFGFTREKGKVQVQQWY